MRVLVVAEIRLYREGLAHALERRACFDAVNTAAPSEDLGRVVSEFRPDVLLLDMLGTINLEMIRHLICDRPGLRIVALGVKNLETDILSCAEVGIQGLVPREASLDYLVDVVTSTMRGELRCSPQAAGAMARHIAAITTERAGNVESVHLTARQTQVLRCLSRGMSNKEIARSLHIEVATVKNHVHQVLEKLGVKRRTDVVNRMQRSGWLARIPEPEAQQSTD